MSTFQLWYISLKVYAHNKRTYARKEGYLHVLKFINGKMASNIHCLNIGQLGQNTFLVFYMCFRPALN